MLVSGAETGDIQQSCVALKTARSMTTDTLHLLFTCFSGCVEELYLRISRAMSMSLSDLSALRILELSMGVIADVSDFSSNCLESLTIIATSKVTFRNTSCEAIGKYLSSTCSLKTCHLRAVDGKTLILSNDQLEAITKGMSDNIALPLKSLEINCKCTFTTTATRSLAQFISKSTTLQYLKLCIAKFEDVDTFTKGMSDNTALPLKSLEIDCKCTFTTTTTRSLAHFITRSTTLQYLRLCSVTFSAQDLIELTEAIHHSSSLQEKKLEELLFHVECSEDVASLKHMFNDHPDMQDSIDWNKLTEIHKSITENNAMEASVLILALEHIVRVTVLCWSNSSISDAGVVALAQALHHNSTLEKLYLSNNSISDAGAVALAQVLHHNSTLKELHLYNNSISDAGAVALAQALHHNSTLERLGLSGNDAIGEEGTCQLVKSLTVNTSIISLSLPKKHTEYATQCREYDTVKDRIKLI